MHTSVKPVEITKVTARSRSARPDLMAVEEPLEIRLGHGSASDRQQVNLAVTMRTPGHDFELATGFLYTEGIIDSFHQVESIKYCEDVGRQEDKENVVRVELKPDVVVDIGKLHRNFYTSSSCGVCGKASIEAVRVNCKPLSDHLKIRVKDILSLPAKLRQAQQIFEHTGGLHAVGLFTAKGKLLRTREDVGRHNAMDKIIGASLVEGEIPIAEAVLIVSGRASFELVQKALRAGVPVMAAVGAPSSLALSLARAGEMTLLGFVKESGFNVYCGGHRVMD